MPPLPSCTLEQNRAVYVTHSTRESDLPKYQLNPILAVFSHLGSIDASKVAVSIMFSVMHTWSQALPLRTKEEHTERAGATCLLPMVGTCHISPVSAKPHASSVQGNEIKLLTSCLASNFVLIVSFFGFHLILFMLSSYSDYTTNSFN